MITHALDHLWQSTLFALAAGLLTLAFTRNSAAIRYWLWFAASMKFLLPFSLLAALGGLLYRPVLPLPHGGFTMRPVMMPFSGGVVLPPPQSHIDWALIALGLWALGSVVILAVWLARWTRLQLLLRQARDLPLDAPMPVKNVAARLEPGLVGIWRPVLVAGRHPRAPVSAGNARGVGA